MANLSIIEKEILEKLFKMGGGYVLDFTDRTFGEFFEHELGIDIFDEKYTYHTGSKANRMRAFWKIESDEVVARCIIKLIEYIELKRALRDFIREDYPEDLIEKAKTIAERLSEGGSVDLPEIIRATTETSYSDGVISIKLNDKVFSHVKNLLANGHYFTAVEESFKIVRKKLQQKTGFERATDAFKEANLKSIFGHEPKDSIEKDFSKELNFYIWLFNFSEMKKLILLRMK